MKSFLFIFYLLTFAACQEHTNLAAQIKRINSFVQLYRINAVLAEFDPNVEYVTYTAGTRAEGGYNGLRIWLNGLRQNNKDVQFYHVRTTLKGDITEADYKLIRSDGRRQYHEKGTIYVPKSTGKINKIFRIDLSR